MSPTRDPPAAPAAPAATQSRLRFGLVAECYDRVRPGYPEQLIDAVIAYGGLRRLDRALDLGAGTGQATVQFAARGLSVLALEPCAAMVEIANARFAATGLHAEAVTGEFETAPLGEDRFALICAATSWHWLDQEVCVPIAARALVTGGTLAVLSTWPLWRRTELREELDRVYATSGAPLGEMGPMCPVEPDPGALAREWVRQTRDGGAFGDQRATIAAWSQTYTADRYVDLLSTYGDHIGLEPGVRERLFAGVHRCVQHAGGSIEVRYETLLALARAA